MQSAENGVRRVDDEAEDVDWSENDEACVDLLGSQVLASPAACLDKCRGEHGLDVGGKVKVRDEYEWIRLVNFCRKGVMDGRAVSEIVKDAEEGVHLADDEALLRPVILDDPLLYSFDEISQHLASLQGSFDSAREDAQQADGGGAVGDAERVILLEEELARCRAKIKELLDEVGAESDTDGENEADDGQPGARPPTAPTRGKRRGRAPPKDDDYYFESYGHLDIHEEMLKDKPRTESYRDALQTVVGSRPGATVLDIGCGTGILCLFAARAGAGSVVGVEGSRIAELAEKIIAGNGFADRIRVERGRLEELAEDQLPRADVIVSEWMGYGLLFESMLDSVLDARDKCLKPGGIMVPCGASIFVQGHCDEARAAFWNDVYGFDFSAVRDRLRATDPQVEPVSPSSIVTDRVCAFDIDIQTVTKAELDFTSAVTLRAARAGPLTGIVVSFDCLMAVESGLVLSTACESTQTHWVQTVLPLREPLEVAPDEAIHVELAYKRNATNPREIDISLVINNDQAVEYVLR